jgi:hypothetical protein
MLKDKAKLLERKSIHHEWSENKQLISLKKSSKNFNEFETISI